MINSELEKWLNDHDNFEIGKLSRRAERPTLERMQTLAKYMGDPQVNVPTIHITGTNGKTSTTRIAESLLRAKGLYTGLVCSPHLTQFNERICLDGQPCSDDQLDSALQYVRNVESSFEQVSTDPPSYFEISIAAAFELFNEEALDVALIEVGMGGLYDATNICDSQVAVITNVALDHMDYLGDTREKIALEKSGIIKEGQKVAICESDYQIAKIFVDAAKSKGATPVVIDEDFGLISNESAVGGRLISFRTPYGEYRDMFIPLFGSHQGYNAMLAVVACELFVDSYLGQEIVEEGFSKARSPGRMEVLENNPLVIVDGAHNIAGAQTFARAFEEDFERARRIYVLGLTREKDAGAMINSLAVESDDIVIATQVESARAMPVEVLAQQLKNAEVETIIESPDPRSAIENAKALALDDDHIVVAGSLYLVGEIRTILLGD